MNRENDVAFLHLKRKSLLPLGEIFLSTIWKLFLSVTNQRQIGNQHFLQNVFHPNNWLIQLGMEVEILILVAQHKVISESENVSYLMFIDDCISRRLEVLLKKLDMVFCVSISLS